MKIRYYKNLDAGRWLGFLIAMTGCFVLSNADVNTQWMGWAIACISCGMWIRFAVKDKDIPRALMDCMYLLLSIRAVWNWLV